MTALEIIADLIEQNRIQGRKFIGTCKTHDGYNGKITVLRLFFCESGYICAFPENSGSYFVVSMSPFADENEVKYYLNNHSNVRSVFTRNIFAVKTS